MSHTPKQGPLPEPYITVTTPVNEPQTPISRQMNARHNVLSPPLDFENFVGYDDVFGMFSTNPDSFQLTPHRETVTPAHEMPVARNPFSLNYITPIFEENHFDMTPKNAIHLSTPKPAAQRYQKLQFSPYMKTADKEHPLEHIESSNKSFEQLKLEPQRKINLASIQPKEQYQDCDEEQEQEDENLNRKPRSKKNSSKGLRNLSITVAEIAREYQKVTYKEVANKLIARFIAEGKIPPKHNNQDVQNAKRRVYDALNVLIAANILVKQGKFVSPSKSKPKQPYPISEQYMLQKLKTQISIKKKNVQHRNIKLLELYNKYAAAINLQLRNQHQPTTQNIIHFPFVFLKYPQSATLQISTLSKELTAIKLDKPFQIWGDIDMAIKLNLHKTPIKGFLTDQIVDYVKTLDTKTT